MKTLKILYFIKSTLPSEKELKFLSKYAPHRVLFRNANFTREGLSIEKCDAWLGDAPKAYKDKYPSADKALKNDTRTSDKEPNQNEGVATAKAGDGWGK